MCEREWKRGTYRVGNRFVNTVGEHMFVCLLVVENVEDGRENKEANKKAEHNTQNCFFANS
jgi:hypothetical protein